MFCKITVCGVGLFVLTALSSADVKTLDLDSVVQQYRDLINKTGGQISSPVQVQATLILKPSESKNSNNWTTGSALRLLHLIKDSQTSEPVWRALQSKLATAASAGSEVKFRANEDQPSDATVHITNHARAELPSANINLDMLVDLAVPEKVAQWFDYLASSSSTGKGRQLKGQPGMPGGGWGGGSGGPGGGSGGSGSGGGGWGGGGGGWGGGGGGGGNSGKPGKPGGGWGGGGGGGGNGGKPGKPGGGWGGGGGGWGGGGGGGGNGGKPGKPGGGWGGGGGGWGGGGGGGGWGGGGGDRLGEPGQPGGGGKPGLPAKLSKVITKLVDKLG